MPSVDNASRREPPLVTAGRMGLLEAGALLVTHGADLEARDGQGRTALWHAVREGGLQKLCGQNFENLCPIPPSSDRPFYRVTTLKWDLLQM